MFLNYLELEFTPLDKTQPFSYSFHVLGTQNFGGVRLHSKCINKRKNLIL